MFDFKSLNEAKSKTVDGDKSRSDDSEQLYNDALKDIETFKETNIKTYLEDAVSKLSESISLKRNNPKPYIKLAYIFFVMDEIKMSVKYLNIAKQLDAGDSPDVIKLQELISEER